MAIISAIVFLRMPTKLGGHDALPPSDINYLV